VPPTRETSIDADLPGLDEDGGVPGAIAGVWRAVGDGTLTPGQAERLTRVVAGYTRAKELEELESRLRALESAETVRAAARAMPDEELVRRAREIIARKDEEA
jgi:hypothetical protein